RPAPACACVATSTCSSDPFSRIVEALIAVGPISGEPAKGFVVAPGEAPALVAGEEPPGLGDQNQTAIASYARAMDHVGVMAIDPHFRWLDRVILDLHFDACLFQRDKLP